MDYEKAYKEAIERAKNGLPIDMVFPELKESEDERMRKALISLIKEIKSQPLVRTEPWDEYITYLEKQKEQKPAECIEDSVKFEEGFKAGRESGLRDGQKYVLDNFDSYGLCKPTEWSEEDELMRSACIAFVQDEKFKGYERSYECVDWLKSLHPQSKQLKESYKEGFQTARHETAMVFMEYCDKIRPNEKMCLSNGECEDIEKAFLVGDWEKIERYFHKYSWKPSEKQMQALCRAYLGAKDLERKLLESLYDDLKKL